MNEADDFSAIRADLHWLLGAPPLFVDPRLNWRPRRLAPGLIDHLPAPLLDDLDDLRQARLGPYFEGLATALFAASPHYRVLARNRVIEGGGRTLGELDLLLADTHSGQVLHLELALKFYLRLPPADGIADDRLWIGAGLRDFLAVKAARLRDHQLDLPALAEAHGAWPADLPRPDHSQAWALGRCFTPLDQPPHATPLVNDRAPRGHWLTLGDFEQRDFSGRWIGKGDWLAEHDEGGTSEPRHPLPGQFFGRLDGGPARHWFVVPDDWPERARDRMLARFALPAETSEDD